MKQSLPKLVFLSVPEASRICGVTRNTVYTWVKKEKIKAYQTPGRTNLIRPVDLLEFMNSSGLFVPEKLIEMAQEDKEMGDGVVEALDPDTGHPTLLVVDDDVACRRVVVRALDNDYNILQAETGYQALHMLTLHPEVRLVLLDLKMPGQHGLQTQAEIKSIRPDVDVIIVTGYTGEIDPEMLSDHKIAKLIGKPCTAKELQAAVAEVAAGWADQGQ